MRWLWRILAVLGLTVLGLTHLGWISPLGDALSVARPHILLLGLPVILGLRLSGARRFAWVAAIAASTSAVVTWFDWQGPARRGAGELVLYQKNLLWNAGTPADVLADIQEKSPDFITLQEVSSINGLIVEELESEYPWQRRCVTQGNGGIVILSRFPLAQTDSDCHTGEGIVLAAASLPDGSMLWIGSVHLNWPYPYDQARQVPGIEAGLAAIAGPILIAGDFNMVAWGSAVRRIARAARAERVGGYASTFPGFGWFAPLPIDQVMIPSGGQGQVTVLDRLGSDHRGLLLRFSLAD